MNIHKTVVINTIEPAVLSFRAPMGIEMKLDVSFFSQNGAPYTQDLAAQLQLTSRSGNRTVYYSMPSTDVVNGKVRAIIPADTLSDPNGYRVRVTGTLAGEAMLLALGTAVPIAAAGPEAVPLDVIDHIDLSFERDEVAELDVRLWDDTGKTDPFDLASTTIAAAIYASPGGLLLMPFTVTITGANTARLTLTIDQVNNLPDSCWWNLTASAFSGVTTLAEGNVTVTGTVTPPLLTTLANYDYLKPDDGEPASGQIVHGNFTRNILKVSKSDADSTDQSLMLSLLIPGDQISIDLVTWTVGLVFELAGWFEIKVLPLDQAAVTGVTVVTFERPEPT